MVEVKIFGSQWEYDEWIKRNRNNERVEIIDSDFVGGNFWYAPYWKVKFKRVKPDLTPKTD